VKLSVLGLTSIFPSKTRTPPSAAAFSFDPSAMVSPTVPAMTDAMRILAYKSDGSPTINWNVTEDPANARLHAFCNDFSGEDWRKFVFRAEGAINTTFHHNDVVKIDVGKGECGTIVIVVPIKEPGKESTTRFGIKIFPGLNDPGVTIEMILDPIYKFLQHKYDEMRCAMEGVPDWASLVRKKLDDKTCFAGLVATDQPYVYDVVLVQPAVTFVHAGCGEDDGFIEGL
jgi:hypothetical protein